VNKSQYSIDQETPHQPPHPSSTSDSKNLLKIATIKAKNRVHHTSQSPRPVIKQAPNQTAVKYQFDPLRTKSAEIDDSIIRLKLRKKLSNIEERAYSPDESPRKEK